MSFLLIDFGESETMGYLTTERHGGNGGHGFHDDLTTINRVERVVIHHDKDRYVNAIQFQWKLEGGSHMPGQIHGKSQGTKEFIDLDEDEFINRIDGQSGAYVDRLTIYTNKGKVHGPYGGTGGTKWSMSGLHIDGAFGSADEYVDGIGFYTRRT